MEQAARGIVAANAIVKEFGKRILPKEASVEPSAPLPTTVVSSTAQSQVLVKDSSSEGARKKLDKLANPWVLRYFLSFFT